MNRKAFLRILIYAAVFVFFTLLFIVVNYPSDRLTDQVNTWLLSASNGTLSAGNTRFNPPLSLELGAITLKLDQGSQDVGKAVVRPSIFGILSGKKAAKVHLSNPWLNSNLSVVSSGKSLDLEVKGATIDLSGLPENIFPIPLDLEGSVDISMKLLSSDLSREVSSGDINIKSGPVSVGGDLLETLGFAPLKIALVSGVATVEDNVVKLGESTIEGDLSAVARGVIRLSPADYMASRLDLTLELTPGPGNRERLTPIFSLMGARTRADGKVNIRVRGTIGRPSVTM